MRTLRLLFAFLLSLAGSVPAQTIFTPVKNALMTGSADFSGLSNKSTVRGDLGLAIGTNVQAQDAELQAIAGLTSAANKIAYFTGSATAAVTDLSAFARTVIDDGNAVNLRETIGAQDVQNVHAGIAGRLQRIGLVTDFETAFGGSQVGELTVAWDAANSRFVGYCSVPDNLDIAHGTSTDGLNWTVSVARVVGSGNGEEAGDAVRPFIFPESGTQYLFYSDYSSVPGGQLKLREATDWVTFTAPDTTTDQGNASSDGVLFEVTDPDVRWANSRVVKDGATYRMLLEYSDDSTSHTTYATASNIKGPWTLQNGGDRLHTPSIDGTVSYSGSVSPGPFFKIGSTWHWVNWQWTARNPDNYTRIYYNKSSDLIHWTPPRLIRDIEPIDGDVIGALSQLADVNMLEVGGAVYLWTTAVGGMDVRPYLHKYNGTLAQFFHLPPNDEYPEVEAYPDAHQTFSVGGYTDIEFNTIVKATHNSFDGTIFTVPSGAAGKYVVSVTGGQVLNGTTQGLHIRATADGSQLIYNFKEAVTGGQAVLELRDEVTLNVGQQVKIQVYQGGGTGWEAQGTNSSLWRLNIRRVRTNL